MIQQISLQLVKITCNSTAITYTGVQIAFAIKNTDNNNKKKLYLWVEKKGNLLCFLYI